MQTSSPSLDEQIAHPETTTNQNANQAPWPLVTSTRIGILSLGLCSVFGVLGVIILVALGRSGEEIAIAATLGGTAIGSLAGFLNSVWQR